VRPRVEIVIDELILHGFSPAERYAIGDSLSQELERLIVDQGYQAYENVDIPALRTAPVKLQPNATPGMVGSQVANAVHSSLVSHGKQGAK
jgi:hypothetical protein